jgi:hypothetical protein
MGRIEGLFVHREKFTGETENTLDISCSSLKRLGSLHGLAKGQTVRSADMAICAKCFTKG